jgi:hypothetical protein
MSYRLDTHDAAMASLAVKMTTLLRSAALCSHAYTIRRPPRRSGAPTLKRVGRSLQPMCSKTRYQSASTAGRRTPACTLQSRRYTFTASEKRHRQPAVVVRVWEVSDRYLTHQLTSPTPAYVRPI